MTSSDMRKQEKLATLRREMNDSDTLITTRAQKNKQLKSHEFMKWSY